VVPGEPLSPAPENLLLRAIAGLVLVAVFVVGTALIARPDHPPHREAVVTSTMEREALTDNPAARQEARVKNLLITAYVVLGNTTTTTTTLPPKVREQLPPTTPEHAPEGFLACVLDRESEGQYGAVSPGGEWRGGYQFATSTWDNTARHAGRTDLVGVDPAQASPADQDAMAQHLYSWQGTAPWAGGRWSC